MLTKRKRGKTYHADLLVGRVHQVRGSLGTRNEEAASAYIRRIDLALAQGPSSDLWNELRRALPAATYLRLAKHAGVQEKSLTTWMELRALFEADMEKRLAVNDLSANTAVNYRRVLRNFEQFLTSQETAVQLVLEIDKDLAREFKYHRLQVIQKKKGPHGGAGYRSEAALLHRIFEFAVENNMISTNPIQHEAKVGDPPGGAQPFSGGELIRLRQQAGNDLLLFLVFRYTGLRISDVATLTWQELDFAGGMIRKKTKKSRYRKTAVIPLLDELRPALERERESRHPQPSDTVLLNPMAGHAVTEPNLTYLIRKLGERCGVEAHPHRFRDTFAVDCLLKGVDLPSIAKMLADKVDAILDHYVPFVEELRERAKNLINTGKGLEQYSDAHWRHNGNSTDDDTPSERLLLLQIQQVKVGGL